MITIVDYGLGNVNAFLSVFKRLNIPARTASTAAELARARRVILPGVGHFDRAMTCLQESGMRPELDRLALQTRVPLLGVCVGMQMLGRSSAEGKQPGLAWIDGDVRAFADWPPTRDLPRPHMGWNDVTPVADEALFDGLTADARFYFLHSFFFKCQHPEDVVAVANYGADFSCAIRSKNIFGVQFHPEKSHHFGTQLLKNFAQL